MSFLLGGLFFGVVLPLVAIVVAVSAYGIARRRSSTPAADERVRALEAQVRELTARVRALEQGAAGPGPAMSPSAPVAQAIESLGPEPERSPVSAVALVASPAPLSSPTPAGPTAVERPVAVEPVVPQAASTPPAPIDLEQRIGARWATWVGIVAILFAASFFLKWSLDSDVLAPRARVAVGVAAGILLLGAGLGLTRRRDVRHLSDGLAGLGLAMLYLSLWAAQGLYGLIAAAAAFAGMLAVTVVGAIASVVSRRQFTAAIAVLGGLLTPTLLRAQHADERNLLVYLIALDFLVLGIARVRSWPALNRLAWAGSAFLLAPVFLRQPDAPNPLSRLVLVSGLFLLFLAVPLLRERAEYRRIGEIDLVVVVGNAAGYFLVVWATLESWHPGAEAPYALAMAVVYRAAASDYAARVPGDLVTVGLHEGIAWTFLTLAIPLALDGPWVTLAWTVEGLALLSVARRAQTLVAALGGFAAMLLASIRVAVLEQSWSGGGAGHLTVFAHVLVVVALAVGGELSRGIAAPRLRGASAERLRSALWLISALLLALLLWREPRGLWPAGLLTAEVLVLGGLARTSALPAFGTATPLVAAILLARVFDADDVLARGAAFSLINRPLLSRVVACLVVSLAGAWLARAERSPRARGLGRLMAGIGAIALLYALSASWTRHQDLALEYARDAGRMEEASDIGWRTQVGLSILWTLCAGLALAWGFARRAATVRYCALALLGVTAVKVFLVDLAAVRTSYRILSFLILGVVLLLVSLTYQKARRPGSPASVGPAES